ncbi:fluoride efflux transporter CrcB [Bacillus manliponensis]|uniref:fluoride efflux transporter CrcB n=1 Tax=Bacillus manliponensis TaxID=574376 RepID=UPI003519808B
MKYIAVGIGGIVGALARYGIGRIFVTSDPSHFPVGTWLANMIGSFLLAFLTMYIFRMKQVSQTMISAIGTGLIGSFTTFSTFSVETITFVQNGAFFIAVLYVLASVVIGLCMSLFGFHLGRKVYEQRTRNEEK